MVFRIRYFSIPVCPPHLLHARSARESMAVWPGASGTLWTGGRKGHQQHATVWTLQGSQPYLCLTSLNLLLHRDSSPVLYHNGGKTSVQHTRKLVYLLFLLFTRPVQSTNRVKMRSFLPMEIMVCQKFTQDLWPPKHALYLVPPLLTFC